MHHKPNTFCPAPFMSVTMESHDELKPCCVYNANAIDKRKWRCSEFDDWWDTGLAGLRKDMLAGRKPAACSRCWDEESQGIPSIRQHLLENWTEYQNISEPLTSPVFVMAGIGTHCNLKCVFCNPHKSSALAQEYRTHKSEYIKLNFIKESTHTEQPADWINAEKGIESLKQMVVNAKEIHFTGGEPLLTPVYKEVLAHVPDPSAVNLTINTSLEDLSDSWVNIIQQFRSPRIAVSVESADPINDYIRYGSTWATVEKNIQRLCNTPGVEVTISHVFSRTSCWTLPSVYNFAVKHNLQFFLHVLTYPECMQPSGIPDEQRQAVLALDSSKLINLSSRLDELQAHLRALTYDPERDARFWEYIDALDARRGLDFRKIIAEYAKA